MPFINTKTNVKLSDVQRSELKNELGKAIELLDKSEDWLMLNIQDEQKMFFKGDNARPMAFVDISVFGKSTDENCLSMTKDLCKIYNKILGVDPSMLYVKYSGTNQWGWNNNNF